ncbi:hypothetical protein LQ567_23885 [Niabella pedocola]|uniref:Lipocalin-like domain-containing protein n=1 Tax=Niabella pedocola TaxID=1752077 RepID=A0ABS8PY88_9BACT|nr:hypothetical protein [Niabella pedocola]MCD2425845.1 hypothetical protein [Niabella pedocola]
MKIKISNKIKLICIVLLSISCGKKNVNDPISYSWKVEHVSWKKVTPKFTQSGEITPQDSYLEFYRNGKGRWKGSFANRSFSYHLKDSILYMSEGSGENEYKIVTLNSNELTLELNKEKVDWDSDGVAEDIHNIYYCRQN